MAAFNEERTIAACVDAIVSTSFPEGLDREIVIVDDGSTDGTWQCIQALAQKYPDQVRGFQLAKNCGKGAAIRRAIQEMTGGIAIFQDADLEYDPHDIPRILKPILDGRADVVFGSRFTSGERRVLLFWHSLGNRFLTLLSNMLNDTNWSDMETCYKAFTAEALKAMPLFSNRFGIEPEIAAKVARNRFRMYEVPITYHGRSYEDGKKIGWRDGIAALWFIFKYRFFSRYCDAGKATLDALEQAPQFNRWMYQVVSGFLGERVVELGSGKGNLSKFVATRRTVLLTDHREDYCRHLQHRWANHPNVAVATLDMTRPDDYAAIKEFDPESVVFLNVLEHIEDDRAVLRNLFAATSSGCRQVILVPFDMKLFSTMDEDLGHFRRYGLGELEEKLQDAGFVVERQFYFNKPGRLAWYVFNTLGGQRALTPAQLRLYSLLTPIFKVWDRMVPGMGLSTVVVARKP